MLREDVAALYVDRLGPYPKLVREWYDDARDARTYAGPWPVVAHPPCGPWGRLARFCTRQSAELGLIAVGQVRRFGGVLEHPAHSRLFDRCAMPPGARSGWSMPDAFGGRTLEVSQVDWGHVAEKATWLYFVGRESRPRLPERRQPTAVVSSSRRTRGAPLPEMRKSQRHITPPAFAEWLLDIAARARRTEAA